MPVTEDEDGPVDEETSLLPEQQRGAEAVNQPSRATGSGAGMS